MWGLYVVYEEVIVVCNILDWEDVVFEVEVLLVVMFLLGYVVVVVDEVQDLLCVMVWMFYFVVGDCLDGLNLVGDGCQMIYLGGYLFVEVGILINGCSVVFIYNYCNMVEIVEFVLGFIEGDQLVDIDDGSLVYDLVEVSCCGLQLSYIVFVLCYLYDLLLVECIN